jgi:integrase
MGSEDGWESVERWANSPALSGEQKALLGRFLEDERALQSQPRTVFNHIYYGAKFGAVAEKPFEEIGLAELKPYLAKLSGLQSKTPKVSLLKLFKWLLAPLEEKRKLAEEGIGKPLSNGEKERLSDLRRCVDTIRKSISAHQGYRQKLPDELLSPNEVLKLTQAAGTARDKAIIAFLYDTGCRASELCNAQLKHISWEQGQWAVNPEGVKTEFVPVFLRSRRKGERQVYLTISIPFIRAWLNEHQRRDDPEAYLFYSRRSVGRIGGPNVVRQIVERAVRAAGLKKRVHPHLFRHSRATEMAQHMTEQELKLWFGWTGGSRMPATYVHLSPAKLRASLNRMMGIKDAAETKASDALAERYCMKCSTKNLPGSKFCTACGYPLSAGMAVEFEKASALANRALLLRIEELEARAKKDAPK